MFCRCLLCRRVLGCDSDQALPEWSAAEPRNAGDTLPSTYLPVPQLVARAVCGFVQQLSGRRPLTELSCVLQKEAWGTLSSAIQTIFAKEQSKLSYEVLYRNAYNLVLWKVRTCAQAQKDAHSRLPASGSRRPLPAASTAQPSPKGSTP